MLYLLVRLLKTKVIPSGGGCGAVVKKLSKYGMVIKISIDENIEVYIKSELKCKMK